MGRRSKCDAQSCGMGPGGADTAAGNRPMADGAYGGIAVPPGGVLPAPYGGRGVLLPPNAPAGPGCDHPIPEYVYGAGGHVGHRQYRGGGHSHPQRRAGGGVLDVGHGSAGHDDKLCGEPVGGILPPPQRQGGVDRRPNVLPAGWAGRKAGLPGVGPGAGGTVRAVLCAGLFWDREYEPDQFHCRQPGSRRGSAAGCWRYLPG